MWTRTAAEMTITLYIIRHGATKSNKRHAYLGNTNEPLSNEGGEQIIFYNEAGKYPKEKDNLLIFSSPMLRCLQTKDILYPDTRAILLPEWKEIDFGRFEGKNYQDLNGDPDYQRWIDSGGVTAFPGGESRDEFVKRSISGLEWCIACMEDYKQKSAVCIVHGGTIIALTIFYLIVIIIAACKAAHYSHDRAAVNNTDCTFLFIIFHTCYAPFKS